MLPFTNVLRKEETGGYISAATSLFLPNALKPTSGPVVRAPTSQEPGSWTGALPSTTTAGSHNGMSSLEPGAHLKEASLNLWQLRENSRLELLDILDQYVGRKVLVLDPNFSYPLGLVVEPNDLKQHGVDAWYEIGAQELPIPSLNQAIIFLCRPEIKLMKHIARQIEPIEAKLSMFMTVSSSPCPSPSKLPIDVSAAKARSNFSDRGMFGLNLRGTSTNASSGVHSLSQYNDAVPDVGKTTRHRFAIIFVPRRTEICTHVLQKCTGSFASEIDIIDFPLYFIPLEKDVMSLELPSTFRSFHCDGDPSYLAYTAEGILRLQEFFGVSGLIHEHKGRVPANGAGSSEKTGVIPNIRSIGPAASYVSEILVRQRKERSTSQTLRTSHCIATSDDEVGRCPNVPPVKFVLHEEDIKLRRASPFNSTSVGPDDSCRTAEKLAPKSEMKGSHNRSETGKEKQRGVIDCLVMIDRRVDMATPLCTPFTYEAMLDTAFGINSTYLQFNSVLEQDNHPSRSTVTDPGNTNKGDVELKTLSLNNNDIVFKQARDLHQTDLGPFLYKKANEIQQTYKEKDELKSISDINEFMKKFRVKLKEHGSLSSHVSLASTISSLSKQDSYHKRLQLEDKIIQTAGTLNISSAMSTLISAVGGGVGGKGRPLMTQILDEIEEMIDARVEVTEIYRFLCLLSIVNSGIPPKQLNPLRRLIIQQYGFGDIHRLANLETAGLLRSSSWNGYDEGGRRKPQQWEQIKKQFNLLVDDTEAMMLDIAYVCSGYAPLSVRLVQLLYNLDAGWRSCPQALNLLLGPALEIKQQPLPSILMGGNSISETADRTENAVTPVVLVLFIGGVTQTEIAAIRRLSQIEGHVRSYIIATTEIITSKKWLDSFIEF